MKRTLIVAVLLAGAFLLRQPPVRAYQGVFNPYSECTFDGQFLGVRTGSSPPWRCLDSGFPNGAQVGVFISPGSGAEGTINPVSVNNYGDRLLSIGTASATQPSNTEPVFTNYLTDAASRALFESNQVIWMYGKGLSWQGYVAIGRTTDVRFWTGLTPNFDSFDTSDNPAGDYAAFRFSTAAGDTKYQCITKDNVTQEINNSNVTPDTSGHLFEIIETPGTNYKFYIDGSLVCTNNTHIPRTNQLGRQGAVLQILAGAQIDLSYSWMVTRSAS